MNEFDDAADWHLASYDFHPVDVLEPLDTIASPYREAGIRFIVLAECMIHFINAAHDAHLANVQVSIAMGLALTSGKSETQIAAEMGLTKQALSRGVAKFLRMSQLSPAFGLKSTAARRTYQRTNGGQYAEPKDSETPAAISL